MTTKITSTGITFPDNTVLTSASGGPTGPAGPPGPTGPIGPPAPPLCGCFLDGTKVWMPDGSKKSIEDVMIGERIASPFFETVQVIGKRTGTVYPNRMYLINDSLITTGEHVFFTTRGTVCCDGSNSTKVEQPWRTVVIDNDGSKGLWKIPQGLPTGKLTIGDFVMSMDDSTDYIEIKSIEELKPGVINLNDNVTTLITGSSMVIDIGYVVGGWPTVWWREGEDITRLYKELTGQEVHTGTLINA